MAKVWLDYSIYNLNYLNENALCRELIPSLSLFYNSVCLSTGSGRTEWLWGGVILVTSITTSTLEKFMSLMLRGVESCLVEELPWRNWVGGTLSGYVALCTLQAEPMGSVTPCLIVLRWKYLSGVVCLCLILQVYSLQGIETGTNKNYKLVKSIHWTMIILAQMHALNTNVASIQGWNHNRSRNLVSNILR